MQAIKSLIEQVGLGIDAAGVAVIVTGICIALVRCAVALKRRRDNVYRSLRQDVGRGILLGLEFLVAADIIRTVAISPNLQNMLVLGLIVLIRTFLSIALEVELQGQWPWNMDKQERQARREATRRGAQ